MTGLEAVTAVAKHILSASPSVFGATAGRVFKYEKEKGYDGDYIAVNNLPFIHRNAHETAIVNVNVHCKKLSTDEPNVRRLTEIANEVISLFNYTDGVNLNGAYFRFVTDSRPTPDNDNTYYVNLALECIFFDEKTITD